MLARHSHARSSVLRRLASFVCLAAAWGIGHAANAEHTFPPSEHERFLFYPEMTFSFVPQNEQASKFWALVVRKGAKKAARSYRLGPVGDGAYGAKIVCPFVGPGSVRVVRGRPSARKRVLAEALIYCGLPQSKGKRTAEARSARAWMDPSQPPPIPGQIVALGMEEFSSRNNTTETVRRNGSTTTGGLTVQQTTDTFEGTQYCRRIVRDVTPVGAGTPSHSDTTTCSPQGILGAVNIEIRSFTNDNTVTEERVNPAPGPTAILRTIRRDVLTLTTAYSFTARFPDLPDDATVEEIRFSTTALDNLYEPRTSYRFTGAEPVVVSRDGGTLNCAQEIWDGDIHWAFVAPTLDSNRQTTITQTAFPPGCPSVQNGTTVTQGGNPVIRKTEVTDQSRSILGANGLQFWAQMTSFPLTLVLTPDADRVTPMDVPGITDVSTAVRAFVTGGEPNTDYEVRVSLAAFDAAAGGHRHDSGIAPPAHQPTVDGGTIAICQLTTDGSVPPTGDCDVEFESQDIGGIAFLLGEIVDTSVTDEAEVDVAVAGLIDTRPLLGRAGELLRSPDSNHFDADAFWLQSANAGRMLNVTQGFEALTRDPARMAKICGPSAPSYPDGLYLRFNDMSLPKGGRFDMRGDWVKPHGLHRGGTSMDINRNLWDVGAGAGGVIITDCLRKVLDTACRANAGHLANEYPQIHCELD